MVLCFREPGRARASSAQMFYMYLNDISLQKTGWGDNFFAQILYIYIFVFCFFRFQEPEVQLSLRSSMCLATIS